MGRTTTQCRNAAVGSSRGTAPGLFAAPLIRPFARSALRADRLGQGAARTPPPPGGTRGRRDAGRERPSQGIRHETGQAGYRTDRFSISRLIEGVPPAPRSPIRLPRARRGRKRSRSLSFWVADPKRRYPRASPAGARLSRHRYVRLWIFRHRDLVAPLRHRRAGGAGQLADTCATASPFTRLVTWIGIQSAA